MSQQISSILMVGCYYEELPKELKEKFEDAEKPEDRLRGWADDKGLHCASPYAECEDIENFVGIYVPRCERANLDMWFEDIKKKFDEFKEITGVEPTLFDTPDVY